MGFTQRTAARLIGYHCAGDVCHYERGDKLPSLMTALKLEIIYRTPVAFLFPDLYARLKEGLRKREAEIRADCGHEHD